MKGGKKKMLLYILLLCILIFLLKMISFTPHIKGGISEIREIEIGGVTQSLLIRGENLNNPILLYLHSGPGTTEMISFRQAHKELEKYFTVVIWEQRGTGKSYSPKVTKESMTIAQLVLDAHDITEYLIASFHQDKVLLVGHSWGTALGLLLTQKYPELFYAYVGSGQVTIPKEGERLGYQYLMEEGKDNDKAMKELASINKSDSYLTIDSAGEWYKKIKIQRKWLTKFGGEIYNGSDYSLLFNMKTILAPEYTWIDYVKFVKGSAFSLKAIWPEVMKLDLIKQVPEVRIPIYFFQGRHDNNTPSSLVEKYYSNLLAPYKDLIWFENSGHHPMYEEAVLYDKYMIEKVLPICK